MNEMPESTCMSERCTQVDCDCNCVTCEDGDCVCNCHFIESME